MSEHSYALKPSDARKIEGAAAIFEIGPDLETYLTAPLATLGGHSRVVALEHAPGVRLLPARRGGLWGETRRTKARPIRISGSIRKTPSP